MVKGPKTMKRNLVISATKAIGNHAKYLLPLCLCATSIAACAGSGASGDASETAEQAASGLTATTATTSGLHPLGLKRDTAGTISAHMKPSAPPPSGLPSSVMLTNQVPTPGDQLNEESCTAWAVGYAAKSFHEAVEEGWSPNVPNHQFSPSWLYNQINGGVDFGSSPSDAMALLVSKGADTLSSFPYVNGDVTTQPTAGSLEHASHFYAKSWSTLAVSEASFKNILAGHNIIVIAFEVLPDYDGLNGSTNAVYDSDAGSSRGGHANVIIGYNDTMHAFRIMNSWGTGWGDGGYGWIDYSFINNAKLNLSAYVMVDGYNTPIIGDADGNMCVDTADYQILMNAYGGCKPAAKYDYRADFNSDGCVNMKDYQLWAASRGEGC